MNGRWELLPGGDPLDEVAAAERGAPPGGVALARSAWERVAGIAEGIALDENGLVRLTALHTLQRRRRRTDRDLNIASEVIEPFLPAPETVVPAMLAHAAYSEIQRDGRRTQDQSRRVPLSSQVDFRSRGHPSPSVRTDNEGDRKA